MGTIGRATAALGVAACASLLAATSAAAAITPTREASELANAIDNTGGAVTGSSFHTIPPDGNPAGVFDQELALFPVAGGTAAILSTGDVLAADDPNASGSTSTNNGGGSGGHAGPIFDLVTLRVDLLVPVDVNCLTMEFRFLSEEFPEFVGSEFNDGTVVEIDETNFQVESNGDVTAPNNIAFDPDGFEVTVNSTGTSSDNALGTTYDGGSPVLRASTPIEPGSHPLFISVYDVSDSIYDTAILFDDLRLRNAKPQDCKRGAAPPPEEGVKCQGRTPTVIASAGIANGTKGDDVILGSPDDDLIRARGGKDVVCGRGGDDELRGGRGKDRIAGQGGDDEIRGKRGGDLIKGRHGKDDLRGQVGRDRIVAGRGHDKAIGGPGGDIMRGNRGRDVLRGRKGNDELRGNRGLDRLRGGPGTDRCHGGKGADSERGCEDG